MNDKNRNLVLRVVSALVLLPLVLFLLGLGGWASALLFAVAAAGAAGEYFALVSRGFRVEHLVGLAAAALLPIVATWRADLLGTVGLWTLAFLCIFSFIFQLLRGPIEGAPDRAAHLVMGTVYGSAGLTALSYLRSQPEGLMWVVAALTITWANDTLAYFAGRFLGRHKLYAAVSPNKTWEGFAGGLAGSVLGLFIARAVAFPNLQVLDCIALGVAGGILGPLGDLSESMLKRAYGAKDSGKLVPGHGGVLDRIDALLFNAPFVFIYVTFLRHWMG